MSNFEQICYCKHTTPTKINSKTVNASQKRKKAQEIIESLKKNFIKLNINIASKGHTKNNSTNKIKNDEKKSKKHVKHSYYTYKLGNRYPKNKIGHEECLDEFSKEKSKSSLKLGVINRKMSENLKLTMAEVKQAYEDKRLQKAHTIKKSYCRVLLDRDASIAANSHEGVVNVTIKAPDNRAESKQKIMDSMKIKIVRNVATKPIKVADGKVADNDDADSLIVERGSVENEKQGWSVECVPPHSWVKFCGKRLEKATSDRGTQYVQKECYQNPANCRSSACDSSARSSNVRISSTSLDSRDSYRCFKNYRPLNSKTSFRF